MYAIINRIQEAQGERVYCLGMGHTERDARMAAFAYVHHGHNIYDNEYLGGEVVPADPEISRCWEAGFNHGVCMRNGRLELINPCPV